jgi:hypothetical protein
VTLLAILVVVFGLYTVAGIAARAIETYERMREQRWASSVARHRERELRTSLERRAAK